MSTVPSGLAVPGHVVSIDAMWALVCSCSKTFARNKKTHSGDAMMDAAKRHVRYYSAKNIEKRRVAELARAERLEKKRLALKADAAALWAERYFEGSKTVRELAKAWRVSRGSALRYLHEQQKLGKVVGVRREVQPYRYDWTVTK